MKKIFLIACAMIASMTLLAQDIIVTNDAKKIDAKILEVSKSEIRYKESDNLDGPTFVLETKEINTIVYSNGKVALFNQDKAKEEPQKSVQKAEEDAELKAWIEESDKQNEAKSKSVQAQIEQEATKQGVNVDFDIRNTSNPFMYRFVNLSSGVTDFRWDFGDGKFGFAKEEALCTYEKAGTYTVTLTATVGSQKYTKQKTLTVGGSVQQEQEDQLTQEQLDRLMQQSAESGAKLGNAIGDLIASENSYALDVKNTTKHPYKINLDGHILGVVNPYKTQRFIVSVDVYGRMQAVQTSGYVFSPTIKEYRIPRQQRKTACTVVIK